MPGSRATAAAACAGNLGPEKIGLKTDKNDLCTWLSRDGGLTWIDVIDDVYIYEYLNHGNIIAMAKFRCDPATLSFQCDHPAARWGGAKRRWVAAASSGDASAPTLAPPAAAFAPASAAAPTPLGVCQQLRPACLGISRGAEMLVPWEGARTTAAAAACVFLGHRP